MQYKNKYINQISEKLKGIDPQIVLLFGSYAYGTPHKDSDIDLLVVTKDNYIPQNFQEKTDIYLKVKQHIHEINQHVPIDLLVYTAPMYKKFIEQNSSFAREIAKNGKVIYETST